MADAADVQELDTKLSALIAQRFGGDWKKAFAAYDVDHNGLLGRGELEQLLSDAGIGNFLTRSSWVDGVLAELDKNHDGALGLGELEGVMARRRKPAPAPVEGTPRPDYLFPADYPKEFTPAHPNPAAKTPPAPPPPSAATQSGLFVLALLGAGAALMLLLRRR